MATYDFYDNMEILINDNSIDIKNKTAIMNIKEASKITFRGLSKILKVPVMITFYNQQFEVDVNVAKATEEFQVCDYRKFNMSLGQYMNSIEIHMNT